MLSSSLHSLCLLHYSTSTRNHGRNPAKDWTVIQTLTEESISNLLSCIVRRAATDIVPDRPWGIHDLPRVGSWHYRSYWGDEQHVAGEIELAWEVVCIKSGGTNILSKCYFRGRWTAVSAILHPGCNARPVSSPPSLLCFECVCVRREQRDLMLCLSRVDDPFRSAR